MSCFVPTDCDYRDLLWRSTVALLVCAALVAVCYFFVDRPVAFFVHDHGLSRFRELAWLTYPPPILELWAPLVLVALAVRRAGGPWRHGERVLLALCLSLIVAEEFRDALAHVFGRYWPDTWIHDNPSLIGTGAYGFHFFHSGEAFDSFPSGHSARSAAGAAVVWIAYPRWRWVGVALVAAIELALVGLNYHFVGDIVAGTFVGAFVGTYAAHLCEC